MQKLRIAAFIIFFIAVGAAGAWIFRPQARRAAPATAPATVTPPSVVAAPAAQTAALAGPPPAAPMAATSTSVAAATTKTDVAIQDEKTIDFSSGKPVVKDSAEEKAIIANSVKEMKEAAAGITFGPAPKPAEPAAKPPRGPPAR